MRAKAKKLARRRIAAEARLTEEDNHSLEHSHDHGHYHKLAMKPSWRSRRSQQVREENRAWLMTAGGRLLHPDAYKRPSRVQRIAEKAKMRAAAARIAPRTAELDAKLSAHRWHSMAITVQVHDGSEVRVEEQLADSGAAATVQRATALRNTIADKGFEEPPMHLMQAGGDQLELAGAAIATLGFTVTDEEGHPMPDALYKHKSQVSPAPGLLPLIGVDFWAKQRAVMDYARLRIVIDAPMQYAGKAKRLCIPMRVSRTALEEEAVQADPLHRMAGLASATLVNTVALVKEDMVIKPHSAMQTAVEMIVDAPIQSMNAGTVFRASPLIQCVTVKRAFLVHEAE